MSHANVTDNQNLALISVLDQAVEKALELNISESEIVSRLLERFHYRSDKCRSAVHIDHSKKLFDSKAGP